MKSAKPTKITKIKQAKETKPAVPPPVSYIQAESAIEFNFEDANAINEDASVATFTLPQATVIKEGDSVYLHTASIDTQQVQDGDIVISQDTQVTMAFSIYDRDYAPPLDTSSTPNQTVKVQVDSGVIWPAETYGYYAAYNTRQLQTLNSIDCHFVSFYKWYADIDGNFTPGTFVCDNTNSLGHSEIEFKVTVAYLDQDNNQQTAVLTGSNAFNNADGFSPAGFWHAGNDINNQVDYVTVVPSDVITFQQGTMNVVGYQGMYPGAKQSGHGPNGSCSPGNANGNDNNRSLKPDDFKVGPGDIDATDVGGATIQLNIRLITFTIPKGVYDPEGMARLITQKISDYISLEPPADPAADQLFAPVNPVLERTDDPKNGNLIFRQVFVDPPAAVTFTDADTYRYVTPYFVGASNIAVEYGTNGAVFSVPYAHMGIADYSDPTRPTKENVMLKWSSSLPLRWWIIEQASGVVFHDLQPRSFWQDQLGLADRLIVPLQLDNNGVQFYLQSALQDKITGGRFALDSFLLDPLHGHKASDFRRMYENPPVLTPTGYILYFDSTGITRAIIGEPVSANTNGGLFLLRMQGFVPNRGRYIYKGGSDPNILAVISKEYNSDSIVTGYSDSGFTYIHTGDPIVISGTTVEILDQRTKQPVKGLGDKTVIIFKVVQNLAVIQSALTPKQLDQLGMS